MRFPRLNLQQREPLVVSETVEKPTASGCWVEQLPRSWVGGRREPSCRGEELERPWWWFGFPLLAARIEADIGDLQDTITNAGLELGQY